MKNQTGKIIKDKLKELGKTQGWLAEKASVSVNAVSKWTKTGKIGRDKVAVVVDALGITADQLLMGSPALEVVSIAESTLERLSADERRLIDLYRHATPDGRTMIQGTAELAPKASSLSVRRPN